MDLLIKKFKDINPVLKWISIIFGLWCSNNIYNFLYRKLNGYPPGYYGIPIFGNLSILYHNAYNLTGFYAKMANKYKKISMLYMGTTPQVFINDLKLGKELYIHKHKHLFTYAFTALNGNNIAFSFLNGYEWKYRRELTHRSLTMLVDSKYINKRMDLLIKNKLYPIIDEYCHNNNIYYFRNDLKYAMFGFLMVAYFGKYIDIPHRNHDKYKEFRTNITDFNGIIVTRTVIQLYVGLNNILGRYIDKRMNSELLMRNLHNLFKHFLDEYKEKTKNMDNIEDCYAKRQLEHMVSNNDFNEDKMIDDMWGMFSAGFHVTLGKYLYSEHSITYRYISADLGEIETALYCAAKYPDQQEYVYNELKEYYKNKESGFELKDVTHLHYFRAFIYECLRFNNIAPVSQFRQMNKKDLKIAGYNIPKGCIIVMNITGIHFNKEYFGTDCYEFNMFRWINDKKHFKTNTGFILFGLGLRNCVGQSLALREIYSVLAPLLYRYKFTKPNNITKYNIPQNWFSFTIPQLPLKVSLRN